MFVPPPAPPRTAPPPPPAARKPIRWEEIIGLKLLGWAGVIVVLIGAALFLKEGYDQGWFGQHPWVRVANPTAMGLALLADLGHPVAALCQWHASLKNKVKVPKPGMSQKEMRHSLVSDFRWETVERSSIEPVGSAGDLRVHVFFTGRGQSMYDGRDAVAGMNRQVAGIDGVLIRIPELGFEEDLSLRRTASAICVVAPSNITPKDLVAGIEKAMDKRKLNLSFTVPSFEAVAPGAPSGAKPAGAAAAGPAAAGEKTGEGQDTATVPAREPDSGAQH